MTASTEYTDPQIKEFPLDKSLPTLKSLINGSTLLVPAPNSIAYISSLAIDLIISGLELKRIAILYSPFVTPFAGYDAYNGTSEDVYTALDVFQSEDRCFTALQIRSPVLKGYSSRFATQLTQWIQSNAFSRIIVVTGADSGRRIDSQIQSSPLRFVSVNDHDTTANLKKLCVDKGLIEMEQVKSAMSEFIKETRPLYLPPGSGMSNLLLSEFKERNVPSLCLSWFASEGDNMGAAHQFADAIADVLSLPKLHGTTSANWPKPASWSQLYGSQLHTRELY